MNDSTLPKPHPAIRIYGFLVYWLCVAAAFLCILGPLLALAFPARNVANPHFLFFAIWRGLKPSEVWDQVAGGFPGGHFWLRHLAAGDGLTQCGLALGCVSAGIALLAAAVAYLTVKPRSWGWALVCLFAAAMVALSTIGIYHSPE